MIKTMAAKSMRDHIRAFNKRVTNPLMLRIAGARYSPIAVVQHTGRRSGNTYRTPIMAVRRGDSFIFELTYGPDVDWYRNVEAAGGCVLRWHGRDYILYAPESLATETGMAAFPMAAHVLLRLLRRTYFVILKCRLAPAP